MTNGKLIGKDITPTADTRPNGVWNLVDQYVYNRRSVWSTKFVTPYGFQGTGAHPIHASTSVSGTINLGTAHSDREIWIIVGSITNASVTPVNFNSFILGGIEMTPVEYQTLNTTNPTIYLHAITYFRIVDNGSLGTTSSYSINYQNSMYHTGLVSFTSPVTSNTIDYTGNAFAGTPNNVTLNTGGGSWAISVTSSQNSSTGTLPNFGNDGSFDYGSGEWLTYGYNTNPLSSTTEITPSTGAALEENTITGLCRL